VFVIGLGLVALVAFVVLAEGARRGSTSARVGALVEAAVLIPLAGLGALGALALIALRCDESCDEDKSPIVRTGDWWHSVDAWQWKGQLAVALAGTFAVTAAFVAVTRRRYRAASLLMVAAAACFGGWAAFLAPLGDGLGI
jgi:hypothetical protein